MFSVDRGILKFLSANEKFDFFLLAGLKSM